MVYQCGLRLTERFKSGEEPWRAQAASPRQSKTNPNFRGNRVDTIFRAGLRALLFFSGGAGISTLLLFFQKCVPARIPFEMPLDSDPRCRVRESCLICRIGKVDYVVGQPGTGVT